MALCSCGTALPGRRQKCDSCKATGRTGAGTRKQRPGAKAAKPRARKTASAKKVAAKKTPAKKTTAARSKVVYPDGLGTRGRQLWKALGFDADTPGGVLALEACRCADRLERLDSLLAGGESWFDLVEKPKDSGRQVVIIDNALAEARQQQTTFKGMLNELGATRVKGNPGYGGKTGKPAGPTPAPAPPVTPLAAARERRRQREQKA